MPDVRLCLEAVSALLGCRAEATTGSSQFTPQDLVNVVALKEFYKQEGFQELEYPSLGTLSLRDLDEADMYSSPAALEAPPESFQLTVEINTENFFHPQYDYDFTNVKDGDKKFTRGNEQYIRPCGWNRVALRVVQKYGDGDKWLGTGQDAWPVSYQGKGMDGSLILTHGGKPDDQPQFLDAAAASLLTEETKGRGVYSTPDMRIAQKYCKKFKSRVDGKTYQVVLQNRINPAKRKRCQRQGVWVVYIPEDSSDVRVRAIVQESVRPYGLLLKQV